MREKIKFFKKKIAENVTFDSIFAISPALPSLEGVGHHQLVHLLVKARELVDVLTGVDAVGNAEPEVKVERL